tara:strand:+ start:16708 stop:17925 length:1218 start_codon:yes stop_codon:yes gene_type:complete
MATTYASNNQEPTILMVYKKGLYTEQGHYWAAQYKNLVNFHFGEKLLYGRINRYHVPMYVTVPQVSLKNLIGGDNPASPLQAASFVADAFNDLRLKFQESVQSSKISPNETYLSSLKIYKAYTPPTYVYQQHQKSVNAAVVQYYDTSTVKFKDFDEFIPHYMDIVETIAAESPYTYPAFIKNKMCPMSVSGLVIEIADLNPADDEAKITQFINSPNWEFFLNACRSYGFLVDLNAPWRLVADIGSTAMISYALKYGYDSTDSILMGLYAPAFTAYYEKFKISLLSTYNRVRPKSYTVETYCQRTGKKMFKTITPKTYTPATFLSRYSDEYFMRLYMQTRFIEEEAQFSEIEQEQIIHECIAYAQQESTMVALTTFATIINKPYNYRGSLTDYIQRVKLVAATPEY